MGYQESFLYIEPQWKFEKLIRTYEKAEQAGYYRVAGAEPRSVVVLKQPLGSIPAGKRLLWVCGDRGFHSVGGVFGGEWKSRARETDAWRALIWTAPRPVRTPICGGTAWRTTRTVCGRGWRDSTIHSEIWRFVS